MLFALLYPYSAEMKVVGQLEGVSTYSKSGSITKSTLVALRIGFGSLKAELFRVYRTGTTLSPLSEALL